ncbi:hypothetical protein QFC22_000583 [Naganishia vaughanmartiniae]|uniref:Uncharacterized protein n=1 Tax=Naganishia vaughanmartiniae TaxID=1424756 RepID=A0ACC2XRI4_9TREE|nr:hypothetical protein QFC22_000583 [Naganishia vaughanmartiniae]
MEVDTESPTLENDPSAFQSNGLLFMDDSTSNELADAPAAEQEPLNAVQELESFASNGLLDGSMDDTETFRMLGMDIPLEENAKLPPRHEPSDLPRIEDMEAVQEVQEDDRPAGRSEDVVGTKAIVPQVGSSNDIIPEIPVPADFAIQTNGLLSATEIARAGEDDIRASRITAASTATLAITNCSTRITEQATAGHGSSLDQLLEEMESASYTTSEKGKGRAGPNIRSIASSATYLASTATRITETTPHREKTPESASLYSHLNLVSLTAEGETLKPLEAIDRNGKKVVFKRKARKVVDGRAPRPESATGTGKGMKLLETSYHDLLKEIEEEESASAALALQKQYEDEDRVLKEMTSAKGKAKSKINDPNTEKKEAKKQVMWVDKYRPIKFTDLLGEERSHRDVLGWLKEWDKCVYKRVNPLHSKKRARETEELGAGGYVSSSLKSRAGQRHHVDHLRATPQSDALGRPKERVLLMSGPPGLGKTTLAHVVAKQAGYNVFEINASDDRNAGTVSQRIKNALDAGSGLRAKGKPTCVIIDEIDGSAGGDMPLPPDTGCPGSEKLEETAPDSEATHHMHLQRSAQPSLIVNRLRQICEKERLKADTRGLTRLAEMTNSDVRSCLNTLQFMKSRSLEITEKTLRQSSIGMKDSGASLNVVWHNLFVPVSTKGKRKENGVGKDSYVNRLAFEVQSCGDQDKVVQGCFEHYPNLKPLDHSLANVSKAHEWVHFYDRLHQRILSSQEFELMAYTSYAIVPWHSHFASPANVERPVDFPKTDYESYVKTSTNRDVGTALLKSIPPNLRALYNSTSALTELVPLLMRIISPNLKPVNANLVRADDKVLLGHLVDLMLALNLSFYRDKTEDGQPMFRLDPPIDVFIHYDGKRAADIAQSRFAVRQLVSQAMESEALRRKGGSAAEEAGKKDTHSIFKKQASSDSTSLADKPPVDFFGRLVAKKAKLNDIEDIVTQEFRVLYKYNEGSSSALRKTLKMSSMM